MTQEMLDMPGGEVVHRKLADGIDVYCGDCQLILPNLTGFDAVVSDPPYGINYVKGNNTPNNRVNAGSNLKPIYGDDQPFNPELLFKAAKLQGTKTEHTKPIVIMGANHYAQHIPPGLGSWLAWDKSCGTGPNSNFCDCEFAWSNRKTSRNIFHHLWMGVLRSGLGASERELRKHTSAKPVELMAWLMQQARVGLGKTVLDPYMGSGSTGVACIQTGRKFIGIEIVTGYACPPLFDAKWVVASNYEKFHPVSWLPLPTPP